MNPTHILLYKREFFTSEIIIKKLENSKMEADTNSSEIIYKLTAKGQNDRKIDITITAKSTLGDLLKCIDNQTKDKEGWTHYTVGNTRVILNGSSIENALITDKYESTATLDTIIGLTDGSVLTLAQGQPNRNRSREGNVDSPAFSNFAQFKTLVRNVKACNRHAQRDQEPSMRPRYDHPEDLESLPAQPSKSDLSIVGYHIRLKHLFHIEAN